MEHTSSDRDKINEHQANVIALFPEAAKQLLVNQSDLPEGTIVFQRGNVEDLARDAERQAVLKSRLKQMVPKIFDEYVNDIQILQKTNPNASVLDVIYDPLEQKLTAPGVFLKDTFLSMPRLLGSKAREWGVTATVESDYVASIQKRTLAINEAGTTDDLYILEIIRENTNVLDDVYENWHKKDGETVFRAAIDPTYDDIFAEATSGSINRSSPLTSAIEVIEKAFPATTKN